MSDGASSGSDAGGSSVDGGGDRSDSGAQVTDSGAPVSDSGTAVSDSGTPSTDAGPSGPADIPGGPAGTAPIVGCRSAERPARRLASPSPVCEAIGGGRCWYAAPDGSDANPGTFASPLRTPQEAVRQAGPGDVIYLRGGVYDDSHAHDVTPVSWSDSSRGTNRGFISVRSIQLPGWAGGTDYFVRSGTRAAPIRVTSFPGERACASGAGGIQIGSLGRGREVAYWQIEGITLHRGSIFIGGGGGDAATGPRNQVHDILIRGNEVFEYSARGTGNPGLVKTDRGNWGGPYDITVESNILHDILPIDPDGVTRDWRTTRDTQHFGAVSALSCERYIDPDCVGNGRLTVRNNHIYHVPQALYLKNPSAGPFHVQGNVIHDVGRLGGWVPSNITFEENLVYRVAGGTLVGGQGRPVERNGHDLVFRNNTLIGFDNVLTFVVYASGHTIRGNVIQGLSLTTSDGDWNNMGYVGQAASRYVADTASDFASSQLAMGNDFDDNCFVTATASFLSFSRRYDTGSGVRVQHLGYTDVATTMGHESSSDRVADPAMVFSDFSSGDYRISPSSPCAGRGAPVPGWAP